MEPEDKFLKRVLSRGTAAKTTVQALEGCLSDELFAAYLDNLLDQQMVRSVQSHLFFCKACRDKTTAISKVKAAMKQEPLQTAPAKLTRMAKELVRKYPLGVLVEVALEFAQEGVAILKNTGAALFPSVGSGTGVFQLELARNAGHDEAPSADSFARMPPSSQQMAFSHAKAVTIENTFGDVEAAVTLEHSEAGIFDAEFHLVLQGSMTPAVDIRISVFRGDREIASQDVENGFASFKNLPAGSYDIEYVGGTQPIGKMRLVLTEAR
jgi:hypothetical protein